MTIHRLQIDGFDYDDERNRGTLLLSGFTPPPPPDGVVEWYPGPGGQVAIDVPVRRLDPPPQTGIATLVGEDGITVEYWQYSWNASRERWESPVRVNHDGSPFVPEETP